MSNLQTSCACLFVLAMAAALSVASPDRAVPRPSLADDTLLDCRLERTAGSGTRLLLTHTGMRPLPRGTPYVWSSLGTPAPVGEARRLSEDLQPHQAVAVELPFEVHAAGCVARQVRATYNALPPSPWWAIAYPRAAVLHESQLR